MDDGTIDIAVARAAVRRVIEQLTAHDPRADCAKVADAAVRILARRQYGQVTLVSAAEAVREAIHSLDRTA